MSLDSVTRNQARRACYIGVMFTLSKGYFAAYVIAFVALCPIAKSQNPLQLALKAAGRSTLDQAGTAPFHLKATVAPTSLKDKDSDRTGLIEIWWKAPGSYRRELSTSNFHQVEVVDGDAVWQKNEGDFLPDWLDEVANSILQPLPRESAAMQGLAPDKTSNMAGSVYMNWEKPLPMDLQPPKQSVAITESTGLLFYDGGLGWGSQFKDYRSFHGRDVPRTIIHGSPEVTARVTILEDLDHVSADWFDAKATGGDVNLLRLVAVPVVNIPGDLQDGAASPSWPRVTNTPVDGVVWEDLVVDREGRVRGRVSPISDNPAINDYAKAYFADLHFKPAMFRRQPVESIRHVVLRFKLSRPDGFEEVGTARDAFIRGRKASTLTELSSQPYQLKATFAIRSSFGNLEGTYTDTWRDANHWRREALLGKSRFIRTRDGAQEYLLSEGDQAGLARLILSAFEPIPATDTMTESDWALRKERLNGIEVLRVNRGAFPDGPPDAKRDWAYWFDGEGRLLQAVSSKLILNFGDLRAVQSGSVPWLVEGRVAANAPPALTIHVESVAQPNATSFDKNLFKLPGHEWKRQFTAEAR